MVAKRGLANRVNVHTHNVKKYFGRKKKLKQKMPTRGDAHGDQKLFFDNREIRDTVYTRGPNFPYTKYGG